MGWIGIDLDGTLAQWGTRDPLTGYIHYDVTVIGAPISRMVDQVKLLLAEGKELRIFTARVGPATDDECRNALERVTPEQAAAAGLIPFTSQDPQQYWDAYQRNMINIWQGEHLGVVLPITATKDFHMWQLWDDRCIQVITNTGETLQDRLREIEILGHIGGDHG